MNRDLPLHQALLTRMEPPSHLADRRSYVGASEIGKCLRCVIASKLTPEVLDTASMGRMLAGRAMENEVIQLLRIAMAGRLRNTGRNQLEAVHPELPFRAHPDGRVVSDGPDAGDGVLEVKTASASVFKRYQSDGLPQIYRDQVQAQMGLCGLTWAMVVLVSRENLAEIAIFPLSFDATHFADLLDRARIAAVALKKGELPEGEPERGFCFQCPHAKDCSALHSRNQAASSGTLPEAIRLELECEVEELGQLESALTPIQERVAELRQRIRNNVQELGISRARLDGSTVQLVATTRTSLDSKSLQREAPDIYQRFLKTTCFTNLRITKKGERACLQAVS